LASIKPVSDGICGAVSKVGIDIIIEVILIDLEE
jgi:hypothetical protein